jgi:hypothetical protein
MQVPIQHRLLPTNSYCHTEHPAVLQHAALQASAVELPESASFNPEHVAWSVVLNAEQFGSGGTGVGGGTGAGAGAGLIRNRHA